MSAKEKQPKALPEFARLLAGSERPRPPSHKPLGPLYANEAVAFTLLLRRAPDSQSVSDSSHSEKSRSRKQLHISAEEYAALYGADPLELEAASAFLQSQGMTVLEVQAGRRTLSVLGIAKQVNATFGVNLQRYVDARAMELLPSTLTGSEDVNFGPIRSHRGFDGAVYLPEQLAEMVVAVVGLDDRFLGAPRGVAAAEATGASYPSVSAVLQKLQLPNTGAYDETIGILAAQAPGCPGTSPCYLPSDIDHLYFANLPPGYRTRPTSITDVSFTIGTTTYKNNPSQVTAITSLEQADNAILELTQEIATSAAVAQGTRINVYFTEASEQGYLQFLTRVLLPEREKRPTVLSLSLGVYESVDTNGKSASGSFGSVIDELFGQIALLGISVLITVCNESTGKWRLLAEPNLAPQARAGLPGSSSTIASEALSAASAQVAAGAAGGSESGPTHSGHAIPDLCSAVAYSGFFVNGIAYSYTGTRCAASFYAGMTAMLRSAFGTGLGFLSSMLFELKNSGVKKSSEGDDNSDGLSGDANGEKKNAGPGALFFAMKQPNPRHRFWTWGLRLEQFRFTC